MGTTDLVKDEIIKRLTTDDLAWVSMKLNTHYAMVKKSDVLTDEEKNCEIGILMCRALRFGLVELVDRFGYMIIDIPLEGKTNAQIIIPKDYTDRDLNIIESRIGLIGQTISPKEILTP